MTPGEVVPLSFSAGLVVLSFLTAAYGAYVALRAAAQIRAAAADGVSWLPSVGIAAVSMGGIGIWSMHFIGMQAQAMPFEAGYQVWLTLLSFLLAVACSGLALWYVARGRFSAARCLAGGIIAGLGIAAMHYVGIAAMRMPALFLWSLPLIVLSVLIAVAAATAALWLAFNVQTAWQRVLAAVVMAAAVCGMHYTAAAAGVMVCTAPRESGGLQIGGAALPYVVFALSIVALALLRWQLHRSSLRFRQQLARRVDALIGSGAAAAAGDASAGLPRRG
ncbi:MULTISPECIES: MHYT domain-containing protein [Bordetella]|uniref:Signal protein n=2 Tax=Bordetella TaxID=517 RepID=A0A261W0G5_9BORD|nr:MULTISPECIES: MHYT domain-containing protein [Bordetella]MDM9558221.1 MHYT domain-containing protein [Bordetella petrii]OZI79759.1 signal protein [Bordetella genomosp. 2]